MKNKIIFFFSALLFLFSATSFADFTYTITASNNGDLDGPAIASSVTVYLAAAGADCNATPAACNVNAGTIAQGATNIILTPTSADSAVSVWVYDPLQNLYSQCTPSLCDTTADTITAHLGGCLGQTD